MRIALGGIHIESSIFTPYRSGEKDFRIKRGDELVNYYASLAQPDTWSKLAGEAVQWIGLVYARALPGGIVTKEFFDIWQREFFGKLKKAHHNQAIDVILLDMHGAMTVEGLTDAEGVIAKKVRKILGNKVTISMAMDLHGNVSDLLFESCDLITAYRTAPHIDTSETRFRALKNGILHQKDRLHGQVWYKAKADLPILLPGERTSTTTDPGKSLYALISDYISSAVTDISILMGFPWADEVRNHAVVIALGKRHDQVKKAADKIATSFLKSGNELSFVGPVDSVAGSIDRAFNDSSKRPFFISDTGDNPGAGGTGDSTALLAPLYQKSKNCKKSVLFASIFDPLAVKTCIIKGLGGKYSGLIGAKIDEFSIPLQVTGVVNKIAFDPIGGDSVVLRCDNISIIISTNRNQYTKIEQFQLLDLDLNKFDIVAVKIGYLEPDLVRTAKDWVMALSSGAVNQDLTTLNYQNLQRPMIPFDGVDLDKKPKATIKPTG